MRAGAVEPSEAAEQLRLSCGHLLSAVVISPEGTSFCGACADLAEIVQAEAETREEDDSEPVEGGQDSEGEPSEEAVEAAARASGDEERSPDSTDEGASPGLALAQPKHSVRGSEPGPKGCWAVARRGGPCHAAAIRGQDYCAGHAGVGVSGNPAHYSPLGQAAHREKTAVRATMRAMYGTTRRGSPRAVLRAHVDRSAERLVGSTLGVALDESIDPIKRANLALRLIEASDPRDSASLTVEAEFDPSTATLSELISFARAHGIETPVTPQALPAGS